METTESAGKRDWLNVLVREWKLTVGIPVVFGLLTLLVCSLQTPVYEATATLYVTAGTNGEGRAQPYENVLGAAGRVTSYVKLAYADEVIASAINDVGLDMTTAEARASVRSAVVPESEMFTISAQHKNREVARRFAGALAHSITDTVAFLEVPNGGGHPAARLSTVTPATVNPNPVAPNTLMNVILATLGGLLIGAAAALTRERLNNTVRDERDIESLFGSRLLGRIPHDEILGAEKIIDFGAPATAAAGAFRHLRTALAVAHAKRSLTTILVTSPRRGDGKSTLALNLAAALAESGSTVVVVDADLDHPAVAKRTGNFEGPGLADAIRTQIPLLQPSTIDNLKVISAGGMSDDTLADLLASSACGIFFDRLVDPFDYVIVDAAALSDGPEAEELAQWTDGVLLVARQGRSKISECDESAAQLAAVGAELVGVVLNDARPLRSHALAASPPAARPRLPRSASATSSTISPNGSPATSPDSSAMQARDQNA